MGKRKASQAVVYDYSTDSNSSFTDCENESGLSSAKRKLFSNVITDNTVSTTNGLILEDKLGLEETEHSYSCAPMFTIRSDKPENYLSVENIENISHKRRVQRGKGASHTRNSTSSDSKSIGENINATSDFDDDSGLPVTRSKRTAKCFSRNAVNARINRLKKKQYINTLEGDLETLKETNRKLLSKLGSQNDLIGSLKGEIQYLRCVLANSKEIGILLKRVCSSDSGEIKMTSSLIKNDVESSLNESPEKYKGTVNDISDNYINSLIDSFDCSETTDINLNKDGNFLTDDVSCISDAKLNLCELPLSSSFDLPELDDVFRCETPTKGFEEYNNSVSTYGVCLHVANKQVSVEFCASCNESASTSMWNVKKAMA